MSAHHAACDGLGALRFVQSVARSYAGVDDPVFEGDHEAAFRLVGVSEMPAADLARRVSSSFGRIAEMLTPTQRFPVEGGNDEAGFETTTIDLPLDPVRGGSLPRALGATVNDVLVAALHLTVDRWTADHGDRHDRIAVAVPIDIWPPEQEPRLVGNFVLADLVSTRELDRTDAAAVLRAVVKRTRTFKREGVPFPLPELVSVGQGVPTSVMTRVPWLFSGIETGDITVLSNLGRADREPFDFGPDRPVTRCSFSPPVSGPRGLGVGATAWGEVLAVVLRWRRSLLDRKGGQRLAQRFCAAVSELVET